VTEHSAAKGKIIGAIVVVVIVAIAAWWYFTRMPGVDFTRRGPAPSGPAAAATVPPPIEHPIEMAQTGPAPASTTPLPMLDSSDDVAAASLAKLPGADALAGLLVAKGLIPHIVATVDALPRHTIGASILPLQTPKGAFATSTAGAQPVIDAQNFARYAPYMQVIENVDARTMVTWYVHWYPLFQQAYRQLGYPHGYFNDRLIAAIDDMLAAPNAGASVAVFKGDNGLYKFADPTWEALSVGQKLMIRVGPDNERTLKIKLHRIRALLEGNAVILSGHAPAASGP
jgi:hypothetical protein